MNRIPLGLPESAAAHAPEIDQLMMLVHGFMAVLFVGWAAFFLYCLVRFRRKRNPVARPEGVRGRFSVYGEAGVVLVEVVLLAAFALPIWYQRVNAVPPESESVVVRVVAEQFAWNIHYPGADGAFGRTRPDLVHLTANPLGLDPADPAGRDDVITLNEMRLPAGQPAVVHLTSKDVIHSFALPEMRVKQDAIPGMSVRVWFEPTRPGRWEIACAQLCGVTHYRMRGFLEVQTPAEFQAWLAENAPRTPPSVVAPLPPRVSPAPEPATPAGPAPHGSDPAGHAHR